MPLKDQTFVIGHKNPDTDSICSAIGLAELKRLEGLPNVSAARAGDINPQTSFILDHFKADAPRYLPNVYPKATDVMSTEVVKVSGATPLLKVMDLMREEKVRFIPVVDAEGRPEGALTLMDLARKQMLETDGQREVATTLPNIASTLNAEVALDFIGGEDRTFSLFVGAMGVESFLNILGKSNPKDCAVIVGDRADIQKTAIERAVGLLIISGGFRVEGPILEEARKKGVSIIITPSDTATAAQLVRLSTPARRVVEGKYESASADELVSDLKQRLGGSSTGIIVVDSDNRMLGIVTKTNILRPPSLNLILVDHNELSQAVDGAEAVNIVEVIDHHRIGNFHTVHPIPFICEPVGSTSTLVAELFRRKNLPIKKETAGLLLGGALSDTVILKSPTTTQRDREIVGWLEEKAGLDHRAFGTAIFSSTSSLKGRGPEAAVGGDFKVFEARGRKFGIGQFETIGFEEFHEERLKLKEELLKIKEKKDLKLSAVLVTDIVMGTSLFLAVGEKEVMLKLDYPKLDDGVYELKNVLSRKKQVVPHILGLFNSIY